MQDKPLESLDPKLLGEQLRNARKARALTQDAAAAQLGYARTTVVAIEKGERRVTPEELLRFARLYERPVSDFVNVRRHAQPLLPQFRAGLSVSQTSAPLGEAEFFGVAEQLQSLCADYLELEQLCGRPLPKSYPPLYSIEDSGDSSEELGEQVALAERNRLGLGDAPILDLRAILEESVGLRIFYFSMPSLIAGVFAYNDELGGCIGINSQHPAARGNWSLAHEYGHFLTTRYQSDVVLESGRWARPFAEQFADRFAASFQMPRGGINRRFSELRDARPDKQIRIADLLQLAQFYRVSVQALALQLESLRRLPRGTWEQLKARGLKPEQARAALGLSSHDSGKPPLLPQRYLFLAKEAYEEGLLSEGQLARKLRADRVSARVMLEELDDRIEDKTGANYHQLHLDLAQPVLER
jgi:Zn-dependent peptidase ImmA (M78 family)/DNA-binding XRE family transcriptional regulator